MDKWVTISVASEMMGVHRTTVNRQVKSGYLEHKVIAGKTRVNIQHIIDQKQIKIEDSVHNDAKESKSKRAPSVEKGIKTDIENQGAQTRTLVNAHDNRWQHEIQKIHEDHSKEIRELRDEYKDESKRKMMPFYLLCVLALTSLGGLLWYFNEQIKAEKLEKKAVIEMGLTKESELKKEHSEEVSLIQKEAKTAQNEIQLRLEASRLKSEAFQVKSEASRAIFQSKIDQLNEGRVVEAKAKAELSAELKILQADFERQKIEIQKEKSETKLKEGDIEQTILDGSERW